MRPLFALGGISSWVVGSAPVEGWLLLLVGACLSVMLSSHFRQRPFLRTAERGCRASEQKVTELFAGPGDFARPCRWSNGSWQSTRGGWAPIIRSVPNPLYTLATLYMNAGSYADASRFTSGLVDPGEGARSGRSNVTVARNHAFSLNNLANVYLMQGKYADAERSTKRSLATRKRRSGQHIKTSPSHCRTWPLCTRSKASTPAPSRSTSGRSRFGRRRSGPTIPKSASRSITWPRIQRDGSLR